MAHVLLVDDDEALREVLTVCLELDDHRVKVAAEPGAGLALLQQETFDVVLTDLFAPVFTLDALAHVGAFRRVAPSTPVVVQTAHAQAGDLNPMDHDLAAILLKPFDLEDLLICLRSALSDRDRRVVALQDTSTRALDRYRAAREHITSSLELLKRVAPSVSPPSGR